MGLAACASGGRDATVDATPVAGDAAVAIDALVDAPPGTQTKTLSQTTTMAIEGNTSIACASNPPGTNSNNYYRVFDLAAAGITTPFTVTGVAFSVEHCDQLNGTAGAVVAVRVGTYDGTPGDQLDLALMTVLASNPTVQIPEVIETNGVTAGAMITAPISATIQPDKKLFVEIDAPDGHNQYALYLGANNDGETSFGYVLAPGCTSNGVAITKPLNISAVSTMFPAVHLLITVTGQYQP
jgi:hypothetical protein